MWLLFFEASIEIRADLIRVFHVRGWSSEHGCSW